MELTFDRDAMTARSRDEGFSLVELLVVIVTIGLLATIVVFGMVGFRDDTHASACPAEWRNLNTAVESYFTQQGTTTIVAVDATPDGYERTLVNAHLISHVSDWYDLDPDGQLIQVTGSPCIA